MGASLRNGRINRLMLTQTPQLIATPAALADALAHLTPAEWIAVDTEFMRVSTYYPRLCLVQVATATAVYCIDPLQLTDLSPLYRFLMDPRRCKILHAARQDLEIFWQLAGTLPSPLFDTQIAAGLLALPDQVAYAWLVEKYCQVTLDKSQTRTDWGQRPLSAAQIEYSALDVWYLGRLHDHLAEELRRAGKLAWLQEDCERLVAPDSFVNEPSGMWRRLKGINSLGPRQLPVLAALAAWRERLARERDKPRGWVVRDEALLELAKTAPRDLVGLQNMSGLPGGIVRRHGEELLALINHPPALAAGQSDYATGRLTPAGVKLVQTLMTLVQQRAQEVKVVPSLLSSRKELERALAGDTGLRVFTGWRSEVIGRDIQRVLDTRRERMPVFE